MAKQEREHVSQVVRDRVLRCRTSGSEYDSAVRAAEKAGRPLSEWLRELVRANS